jgi:hypothetical protein
VGGSIRGGAAAVDDALALFVDCVVESAVRSITRGWARSCKLNGSGW